MKYSIWATLIVIALMALLLMSGCSSVVSKETLVGKWEMTEGHFTRYFGTSGSTTKEMDITGKYIEFLFDGSYCTSFSAPCGTYLILDNGKLELNGPNWEFGELSTAYSNIQDYDVKISWGSLVVSTPSDYRFTKFVTKFKKAE